jgi:hypothetical protein
MQLVSINVGSKEFPNTLARLLASQEGMVAAMSAQGDDALVLVDILDQVSRLRTIAAPRLTPAQTFETPNMDLDLRRKCIRIHRRVCDSEAILSRSCILSDNISKEGDIVFAYESLGDVWKGRNNGELACIKAFRASTAEYVSRIKQVCGQRSCV